MNGPVTDEAVGDLKLVHTFTGPMPTGVSVSHTGRIFVNFPKWGDEVTATVVELRGGSDGLETDDAGRLYLTSYEHNAVLRRRPGGEYETVAHDPRLLWPDTMSVAAEGYLYVTANQLHRQATYQGGKDLRRRPYALFRTRIDAGPVRLR